MSRPRVLAVLCVLLHLPCLQAFWPSSGTEGSGGLEKWMTVQSSSKSIASKLTKQIAPILAARSKERSKGICNWYRHQDYARLSHLAYELGNSLENADDHMTKLKVDACYTIVPDLSSKDHIVFQNKVDGHGVIAYRGTELEDGRDLGADAHILFGVEEYSLRFANATAVAIQAIIRFGERNVRVTGHSLGGTQALHVSRKFELQAYVFNPGAGGNLGLQSLLSALGRSLGIGEEQADHSNLAYWIAAGITSWFFGPSRTNSFIFTTCWDPVSISVFYADPKEWSGYEIIPKRTTNFKNPHGLDNFMYDYDNNLNVGQKYFLALESAITDAYQGRAYAAIYHVDQNGRNLDVYVSVQPKGRWSTFNWKKKDWLARGTFKEQFIDPDSSICSMTTFMGLDASSVAVHGSEEPDSWTFTSFLLLLMKIVVTCTVMIALWLTFQSMYKA